VGETDVSFLTCDVMLVGDPPRYQLDDIVGIKPIPEVAEERIADNDPPKSFTIYIPDRILQNFIQYLEDWWLF